MTNDGREPTPLGVAVKELRQRRGWTQAVLADKAGLSVTALSNIESGVTIRVSRPTREALANVLDVQEGELDPAALGEDVAVRAISLAQRRAVVLALETPPDVLEKLFAEPRETVAGVLDVLRELSNTDRRLRRRGRRLPSQ